MTGRWRCFAVTIIASLAITTAAVLAFSGPAVAMPILPLASYDLACWNVSNISTQTTNCGTPTAGDPFVLVDVFSTTLRYTVETNGSALTFQSFAADCSVAYNGSSLPTSFSSGINWATTANHQCDGFGTFADTASNKGNDAVSPLTVGPYGTLTDTDFLAHINFGSGCSAFVSDITLAGDGTPSSNANCPGGLSPVPEPGTLASMSTGLLGLAGFAGVGLGRRRRGRDSTGA